MNRIIQTTVDAWHQGRRIRQSSGGWQSGNAVCCTHRGETVDTRSRGGLMVTASGVSWHCFNCGFKTGYKEGHPLGFKFRKLLLWLGVSSTEIETLRLEAMRYDEEVIVISQPRVQLIERALPPGADLLSLNESRFLKHAEYIKNRGFDLDEFPFLVTQNKEHRMHERIIIPFSSHNKIVGYTARLITEGKPKYYSQHDPSYVFGIDVIKPITDQQWIAVTEGIFDSLCLGGIAVLGAEVRDEQAEQIEALQRKIIVVPDRNKTGMTFAASKPNSIINTAIDFGWNVAFPDWENDIVDVNQATKRYGRLYTTRSILDSATSNPVSIKLRARKYAIINSIDED